MSKQIPTLEIAHEKLNRVLRAMGRRLVVQSQNNMAGWSSYALKRFVSSRLSGGSGALQRRTGNLARSFRYELSGAGMDSQARFLTGSRYAGVQERGKTIKAKKAKFLAVPMKGSPALTAAGVSRVGSPLRQTLPATFPQYRFWIYRGPSGGLFLMGGKRLKSGKMARGKQTQAQAWFKLVKSVTLRPRMKFVESFRLYVKVFLARLQAMAQGVFRGK